MKLERAELETLTPEVLKVFGIQPPLLTAGDRSGLNTMTIGWCQLGCLWSQPVCTVFVRPERYTHQFMESHDYFTVSVLPPELKKILFDYVPQCVKKALYYRNLDPAALQAVAFGCEKVPSTCLSLTWLVVPSGKVVGIVSMTKSSPTTSFCFLA